MPLQVIAGISHPGESDADVNTLAPSPARTAWDTLSNLMAYLPRCVAYGTRVLLGHLPLRAARRAEYEADRSAARAGSTGGAAWTTPARRRVCSAGVSRWASRKSG
ncbi:hypothetical protein ACFW7J_11370 [Streptomyces sp. NPDC059525]|uniref:hypothetical protein n=1 Tax=Streptomyces sp. NPDC059525 TaxID=3346857 RepID=UPI0036C5D95B